MGRKIRILLVDSDQDWIAVRDENESTKRYFFEMGANSNRDIPVTVPIDEQTRELTFLIVKMPHDKLKEFDLVKADVLREVLSLRHPVANVKSNVLVSTTEPDRVFYGEPNDFIIVSTEEEKLRALLISNENRQLFLSVRNNEVNGELPYAIVAFKNWEQHEVVPGHEILYTQVPFNQRNVYKFNLPDVNEESNFQFLALPYPFQVKENNYISQETFGSFRVLIEPKQ